MSTYLSAAVLLFGLAGCADLEAPSAERRAQTLERFQGEYPIRIVCTTGMVADLVVNVGGDHVEAITVEGRSLERGGEHLRVAQLMGEGVDPHLYKASPGDLSLLDRADLIFYSGLHLEGKLSGVFVRMARRKPTFAVTEELERSDDARLQEVEDGYYDPHIWFDVSLWSETVTLVGDVLARFDPDHAEDYRANAAAYRQELEELHNYCRKRIATIPERRRVLITAHDAFHYFGDAYGIDVKAIQGISTATEASARKIEKLVDFMVEREIKAVFVETTINNKNVQLLIEGCEARGHDVAVGGELFSDAMGRPGTDEGTYTGMVRHNVDTIVEALQ